MKALICIGQMLLAGALPDFPAGPGSTFIQVLLSNSDCTPECTSVTLVTRAIFLMFNVAGTFEIAQSYSALPHGCRNGSHYGHVEVELVIKMVKLESRYQ